MSDVYNQWTRLTPTEKGYLLSHPGQINTIKNSKDIAFQETQNRIGNNGHNDNSDAFRHCFWSAMLARDLGVRNAERFTSAHENYPSNPADEKAMDLHNNSVGLIVGSSGASNETLSSSCLANLASGHLKSIK